jgi:hypothetical protein
MPAFALSALRYWKLIGIGLLCLALAVQTVRLSAANNRADRIQINLNEARAELKAISDRRNEQAETTKGNIEMSEKQRQIADKVAERIEHAPLTGDCRTPDAVSNADI